MKAEQGRGRRETKLRSQQCFLSNLVECLEQVFPIRANQNRLKQPGLSAPGLLSHHVGLLEEGGD